MKNKNLEEFIEEVAKDAPEKYLCLLTAKEILRVAEEWCETEHSFGYGKYEFSPELIKFLKSYITKAKEAEAK